jgi:NAD(P)-dependent dehydrogenase (short-subunit alcohol dehydrogenase family)
MAANNHQIIVITGVTRGLGLALAEQFIARGHTVLGCGRTREGIERLRQSFAVPHDFDVVDVVHDRQVQAWAERLLAAHGAPDLLLNNAAIINPNAPLWRVPAEEFDRVIDVNIRGVANVVRHFVPAMIENKKGVIVNFSSGWGRSTSPEVAPYCASKWAIEGLTRALAQELPAGMAAVPLNPGIIDANQYPDAAKWAEQTAPFLLQLGGKDNGIPLTAPS